MRLGVTRMELFFIGGQDLLLWPWANNEALNNTASLHFKPALVNLQLLLHAQL